MLQGTSRVAVCLRRGRDVAPLQPFQRPLYPRASPPGRSLRRPVWRAANRCTSGFWRRHRITVSWRACTPQRPQPRAHLLVDDEGAARPRTLTRVLPKCFKLRAHVRASWASCLCRCLSNMTGAASVGARGRAASQLLQSAARRRRTLSRRCIAAFSEGAPLRGSAALFRHSHLSFRTLSDEPQQFLRRTPLSFPCGAPACLRVRPAIAALALACAAFPLELDCSRGCRGKEPTWTVPLLALLLRV
ncbi:MAG: hypothetical protein J3K34DRAFT_432273 [Monoraphidium minutum]|nr:MAG: hypothetical protein J3K34DRAFT_432273 [Monoraphidium minutum]